MERELEKTLMEIEHLIKVHEQRDNTHTQSVLQIAYEVIEPCAKVARTLPDLKEILERDTEKEAIITGDNHAIGCKVGVCPKCWSQISGISTADSGGSVNEAELPGQMTIFDFPDAIPEGGQNG